MIGPLPDEPLEPGQRYTLLVVVNPSRTPGSVQCALVARWTEPDGIDTDCIIDERTVAAMTPIEQVICDLLGREWP